MSSSTVEPFISLGNSPTNLCLCHKLEYWSPGLGAVAAMFPNADDHLRNWVENPNQYNLAKLVQEEQNANSHSKLTSKKY